MIDLGFKIMSIELVNSKKKIKMQLFYEKKGKVNLFNFKKDFKPNELI